MVRIMMPVTKAIIDPTDRARQRDEITKVAPTAMMAIKAERVTTLAMLVPVAKFEFSKVPTRITTANAMNGPMEAQRMRRCGLVIDMSVVAAVSDVQIGRVH